MRLACLTTSHLSRLPVARMNDASLRLVSSATHQYDTSRTVAHVSSSIGGARYGTSCSSSSSRGAQQNGSLQSISKRTLRYRSTRRQLGEPGRVASWQRTPAVRIVSLALRLRRPCRNPSRHHSTAHLLQPTCDERDIHKMIARHGFAGL